jgi:hypothetical protein
MMVEFGLKCFQMVSNTLSQYEGTSYGKKITK